MTTTLIGKISHDLTRAQLIEALDLAKVAIADLDQNGCDVLGVSAVIEGPNGVCAPVITLRADGAAEALGGAIAGLFALEEHRLLVCKVSHYRGCILKWSRVLPRVQEVGHA